MQVIPSSEKWFFHRLLRGMILLSLISIYSCGSVVREKKICGFNLESPPMEIGKKELAPLIGINSDWVAVVPYGYTPKGSSKVYYDSPFQWWGERPEGVREIIAAAKSLNRKVMLKPQVWIPGNWVGDFYPEDRKTWEESMREFVMEHAYMAEDLGVELFCLATEYKSLATEHPDFFEVLIDSVRSVYSGKLTYAANWDEYELITFWDKLDYIGVNAYFPLSASAVPPEEELSKAWEVVLRDLESVSNANGLPILFTEFGYRSVEGAAGRQWELDEKPFNEESQAKAFTAFFDHAWKAPWCAGGFVWKWRFFENAGGQGDRSYTPQGKKALEVIKKAYQN